MPDFIGTVRLFGGTQVPKNYQKCDGHLIPIRVNPALYSIVGSNYGGDGVTTFAVPNLTPPDPNMMYVVCTDGWFPPRDF